MKESDFKTRLVREIKTIPGAMAMRNEDRFAVGRLDMIIKLPGHPLFMAEGKIIEGNLFAPTPIQFTHGKRWGLAGVDALLIGWKASVMYVSEWTEQADIRNCFSRPQISYAAALVEYLK